MKQILISFTLLFAFSVGCYAQVVSSAVALTSPVSGSVLSSPSTTFTWAAGPVGTTGYGLNVGTTGIGSANLINIGPLQGTSVTVKFPVNFATIYVRLWTESAGTGPGCAGGVCYVYNDYTYQGTLPLTGFTCTNVTSTATNYLTVLTWIAPSASTDPVVSYVILRALSGSTTYTQIGTATTTAFVDTGVLGGQTYDYEVESVDAAGIKSAPSNMAAIPIP